MNKMYPSKFYWNHCHIIKSIFDDTSVWNISTIQQSNQGRGRSSRGCNPHPHPHFWALKIIYNMLSIANKAETGYKIKPNSNHIYLTYY